MIFISCKDNSTNNPHDSIKVHSLNEQDLFILTDGPYATRFYDMKVYDKDIFLVDFNNVLYHSSDKGKSWSTSNLKFEGDNSRTIYFSDQKVICLSSYDNTHFYLSLSSDNGISWTTNKYFKINNNYYRYLIGSSLSGVLFVCSYNFSNGLYILIKSTDQGATWKFSDSLGYERSSNLYNINDTILLIKQTNDYKFIIMQSIDDGDTWSEISSIINTGSYYNTSLFIADSSNYYICTNFNIYKSMDYGINWYQLKHGLYNESINSLLLSPKKYLYLATYSGIYRSKDRGENWKFIIENSSINKIGIDKYGIIYLLTNSGRVYRTINSIDEIE